MGASWVGGHVIPTGKERTLYGRAAKILAHLDLNSCLPIRTISGSIPDPLNQNPGASTLKNKKKCNWANIFYPGKMHIRHKLPFVTCRKSQCCIAITAI